MGTRLLFGSGHALKLPDFGHGVVPCLRAGQEIDVGFRDQVFGANPEFAEQLCRDALAFVLALLCALSWPQHHLQFEKISQPLHLVDVDSRWADPIEGAYLLDRAGYPQRLRENVEQNLRVGGSGDRVARAACAGNVGSFLADQCPSVGREDAKLQACAVAAEKDILLVNNFRGGAAQPRGGGQGSGTVLQKGFDLDVPRYHTLTMYLINPWLFHGTRGLSRAAPDGRECGRETQMATTPSGPAGARIRSCFGDEMAGSSAS